MEKCQKGMKRMEKKQFLKKLTKCLMTNTSGKWQQIGTNKPIISQPLSKGHIKDPTSSFLFFKGKKINIFWKSPDHLLQCGTTEGATGLSGEKKGDGNQM